MKLTEVSARNNKMTIKEHSLEEYEKLIPNYSFMIERRKDYRNWLFERSGARLFLDEKNSTYALVGEHEGEPYILESSKNKDLRAFIEQLASNLELSSLKYWGQLPGSKPMISRLRSQCFILTL